MPEALTKRCLVVVDGAEGMRHCELVLAAEASIGDALAAASRVWGDVAVQWERGTTGIYGRVRPREYVYADGDRIEVYRPLTADPRERRRQRGQLSSARAKSPGAR